MVHTRGAISFRENDNILDKERLWKCSGVVGVAIRNGIANNQVIKSIV
jgi:hypothetical protein